MACTAPLDAFRIATENLSNDLYLRASYRSVFMNLIPRGEYDRGKGVTTSTFVIGRSEATIDEEEWTPVALTSGVLLDACTTTYNDTSYGFDEHTYGPEKFGLRSPIVCQDDLIYDFKAEDFLSQYLRALAKRSERSISNRLLKRYMDLVPKSVAVAGYARYDQTNYTLPVATSELTQEMLDQTALELLQDGASDPDTDGWITLGDDGPIFPLYIGLTASQQIQLNNAELRQDYRWADPSMLLKRLGAGRVIRNFRHVPNLFPPRFTYSGGAYVRVNTWVMNAGTKGTVAAINSAWLAAPYEGALVLSPWVMKEELVRPVNSAAGLSWMPKSYFGEWQFVTGAREIQEDASCYDPLKKVGRHFAEYQHAIKPVFPEYGRLIIFKRCPTTDFATVTCS